jgi:hypothetical protein
MARPKSLVLVALLLACAGAGWFWQHQQLTRLRADHARLQASAAELDSLREELTRLRQTQVDPAELERLRQGQSELLRLRGETSRLRQQLQEERQAKRNVPANPGATPPVATEETPPPVETFKAVVSANVATGQTLVTGGWITPDGKRGLVLVEPSLSATPGEARHVTLQARLVTLPEELLGQLGLDAQRTAEKETSASTVLHPDQAAALLQRLENTPGVDVLAAPKVSTLDGREASVKLLNTQTGDEPPRDLGHTIDFVPQVSPDGASINLTVIARLRMPAPTRP